MNALALPAWPPERTLFQEGRPRDPRFDLRTDAAIAYGIDQSLPDRVAGWRAGGYRVHLMTGLAWGHYEGYLLGDWDGHDHWDDAQRQRDGRPKQHGENMPYMTPSQSYARYLAELLQQAIDAGVEAIFLEEPEFWAYTGYGATFERAWLARYGTPYRDPMTDPQAFTQAAELKYTLYRDLIATLCRAARQYSAGRPDGPVRCYIATHSLLNYAHNRIVSPHASLREIRECDGAILQVWSHTARSQVEYEGTRSERMFPVAFLEYGSGLDLVRDSARHLWFLADPVEDRPDHGWDRYRAGYEVTIAASLFYPEVGGFEVMPWPSRVFTGRYPRRPQGPPGDPIPDAYASEVLAMANALSDLPTGPVEWDCGTQGVGVLMADSLMFRRDGPQQDDPFLAAFYGIALPPLMAGMLVRPVGMEPLADIGVPPGLRVLLLSYDGMTPPSAAAHETLAAWVRAGNALLCFGGGNSPYETLPNWWNADGQRRGPWPDLFARLGLPATSEPGTHQAGAGLVLIERQGPIELARSAGGATTVRNHLRTALAALGPTAPAYREQPYMSLRRGQYLIAATLPGAPGNTAPVLRVSGRFVDLFDGSLPVRNEVVLPPDHQTVLIDLDRLDPTLPQVVAASARITQQTVVPGALRFRAAGPAGTTAAIRLLLPGAPRQVQAGDATLTVAWDAASHTALLRHPNAPEGVGYTAAW